MHVYHKRDDGTESTERGADTWKRSSSMRHRLAHELGETGATSAQYQETIGVDNTGVSLIKGTHQPRYQALYLRRCL